MKWYPIFFSLLMFPACQPKNSPVAKPKPQTADELLDSFISLAEERVEAKEQNQLNKVEDLDKKITKTLDEFGRTPLDDQQSAMKSKYAQYIRAVRNIGASEMGIPGLREVLDREQDIFDRQEKWQAVMNAIAKDNPLSRPKISPDFVVLESWKLALAEEIAKQTCDMATEIEHLQGLLWGAEKDRVFSSDSKQMELLALPAYTRWCNLYRRNRVALTAAVAGRDVQQLGEIALRVQQKQSTKADQDFIELIIGQTTNTFGTPQEIRSVATEKVRKHYLWESVEDLRHLHAVVSKMPGYTGKRGLPSE